MRMLVFTLLVAFSSVSSGWAQTVKSMSTAELAAYNKPDREKVLYEGAKKEGKLMWYTSLTGGPNTDVPKVFEAKYPGVQVEVYRGDSDALIARIVQEAQAKRHIVDSVETTFPILKVMQEYKLLAPYFSAHLAAYPDEVKEKAGKGLVFWATDRESYIGLAYNTNSAKRQNRFCDERHRQPRDRGDARQQRGGACAKAQSATDQPAFGFGPRNSRYGDIRRARRLADGFSQPLAGFHL
jgi:hypothetical protein